MSNRPTIIIYRNHLLRYSETFIQAQAESLKRFDYHYVGSRRVPGLRLCDDRVTTLHGPHLSQKVREGIYKLFGFSPFLLSEVRSRSPQLIHAHFGPDAVRAIPLAKALDIPLVVTFHGYSVTIKPACALRSSYSQFVYTLKKHQLQRAGMHFIAVSNFLKNCLVAQGFPEKKVSTHYIGIDTDLFTCQKQTSRTQSVLFVGRLVEVKGCEFFIRAMTKVQAVFPDCEAIIVGDGPLRQFLEQLASRVLHKFRFLGVQPSSVVRFWMASSKVFCVPSITATSGHAEAFGTVFLEAQSMGLPVVTFDTGGISEAVEQGKTGFLLPEKNEEALACKLIDVLGNQALWTTLSENSILRARAQFNIHQQTQKLEDLYENLIFEHVAQEN